MSSHPQPPANEDRIFTSKIVEWDDQKGFGFLRHRKQKLFLHRKNFAERHKRPAKGDKIHYRVGEDPQGRRCAIQATHVNDGGKITRLTWLTLVALIILPAMAIGSLTTHHQLPPLYILVPLALINLVTYFTYRSDKKKARAKAWRTPETSLHLLETIGGWPAALLAQRQFRHKCSKVKFQAIYWGIVIIHIYLATDYLLGWKIIQSIHHAVTA